MSTTLAKSLRGDRISQLRFRPVFSVLPSATISTVVSEMSQQRAGCALVLDSAGMLVGIFTERDFLTRVMAVGMSPLETVEQVMSKTPKTITPQNSVYDAAVAMAAGGYRHLPVVGDDGLAIGVLSVKDVMRYLVEYFPAKVYNLPPTPEETQPSREGA